MSTIEVGDARAADLILRMRDLARTKVGDGPAFTGTWLNREVRVDERGVTAILGVVMSRPKERARVAIAVAVVALVGAACGGRASHAATADSAPSTTEQQREPLVAPPQRPSAENVPAGPRARVEYSVVTNQPVVFVTIDDGFTRDPRVTGFIRTHHWPISAFIIDRLAIAAPSYFRQLMAAGATLNDHTYTHPDLATLDYASQRDQICRATQDFPRLFGVKIGRAHV